ncbi:MAG TPA: hypothetical protein DGG95_01535 [Cytophagales bacterium]|nr:hypothetical protein [Cytophagales bacterium]
MQVSVQFASLTAQKYVLKKVSRSGLIMKIVKGWKKISNKGGYINEFTGQALIITKQEFGQHYHVLLFKQERTENADGTKISPEYSTEVKAEDFAMNWMKKNPNGTKM